MSLEPYFTDHKLNYPFIIVKKQSPDYIKKVTEIINNNKNQFKICVMFTDDENKWQHSNIDYFYKCSFAEEKLEHILFRQEQMLQKIKNKNKSEQYIACFTRDADILIMFDGARTMLKNLPHENRFYKIQLLWITDDNVNIEDKCLADQIVE